MILLCINFDMTLSICSEIINLDIEGIYILIYLGIMHQKINAPSYSIGQAPKIKLELDKSPGPGSYSIRSLMNKGILFSKTPRVLARTNASPRPGPGNYEYTSSIGKGPAPIITSRKLSKSIEKSPGPGYYSPRIASISAKYSFPRQSESLIIKVLPGPGAYSPSVNKKSPSAFMGSASRYKKLSQISPGPGSYNLGRNLKKKFLTFPKARRMQSLKNVLPGPADYSPKMTYQSPKTNLSSNSSIKFKTKSIKKSSNLKTSQDIDSKSKSFRKSIKDILGNKLFIEEKKGDYSLKQITSLKNYEKLKNMKLKSKILLVNKNKL